MEKDILDLIQVLFEIYNDEKSFNEGSLTDSDMLNIIEMLIKLGKTKGKI